MNKGKWDVDNDDFWFSRIVYNNLFHEVSQSALTISAIWSNSKVERGRRNKKNNNNDNGVMSNLLLMAWEEQRFWLTWKGGCQRFSLLYPLLLSSMAVALSYITPIFLLPLLTTSLRHYSLPFLPPSTEQVDLPVTKLITNIKAFRPYGIMYTLHQASVESYTSNFTPVMTQSRREIKGKWWILKRVRGNFHRASWGSWQPTTGHPIIDVALIGTCFEMKHLLFPVLHAISFTPNSS